MKLEIRRMLIFILSAMLILIVVMNLYELDLYLKGARSSVTPPLVPSQKVKIGLTLGTLKEDRWIKDSELLQAKASEYDVELVVLNANNDDNDQITQVRYLLKQNIDVLMIVPTDYNVAAEAVRLAKDQGIPVISYDRLVRDADVDLYVSFDNFKVGELMARRIVSNPKNKNILIVNGAKSDYNTKLIKDGYDSIFESYAKNGVINIIEEHWATNWVKEHAFHYTEAAIKSGRTPDAVLAGNDSLADSVFEVLSEYRLIGKVDVVGQDADLLACQRVVEGTQVMTVYKPIDQLVTTAIESAIKLARREKLVTSQTISDGTYTVDCFLLDPIEVNRYNIDETVIQDGFHLKKEVYRTP